MKIGVIGHTGRLGNAIIESIAKQTAWQNGSNFSRNQHPFISLEQVLQENDYIIDCSKLEGLPILLQALLSSPKPLLICTTGWQYDEMKELLELLAKKVPIMIAPNTSMGAFLQRQLVAKLATILDSDYDIDISEQHHRYKMDVPSGTAKSLADEIIDAKQIAQNITYGMREVKPGARADNVIHMTSGRSGNIFGEHEVKFTSDEEMISIKHVAFSRTLFAKGALKILQWMHNETPKPGIYGMKDMVD